MTRLKPSSSATSVSKPFFFFLVFFVLSSRCSSFSLADDVLEEEKPPVLSVALNAQSPEWLTAVEAFHATQRTRRKEGFKDTHETVREPEHGFVLAERDEGANTRNRGQVRF